MSLRIHPAQQHEGHCEGCGTDTQVSVIASGSGHTFRLCKTCLIVVARAAGIRMLSAKGPTSVDADARSL